MYFQNSLISFKVSFVDLRGILNGRFNYHSDWEIQPVFLITCSILKHKGESDLQWHNIYTKFYKNLPMDQKLTTLLFGVMTPRRLIGRYHCFGKTYCLHLQGWNVTLLRSYQRATYATTQANTCVCCKPLFAFSRNMALRQFLYLFALENILHFNLLKEWWHCESVNNLYRLTIPPKPISSGNNTFSPIAKCFVCTQWLEHVKQETSQEYPEPHM